MIQDQRRTLSRRRLMQLAGVSATALAARPLVAPQTEAAGLGDLLETDTPLRIGVLLPDATSRHPSLAASFVQGLRARLGQGVELLAERVATGYGPSTRGIRGFVEAGPLDLVVGVVGIHTATRLHETLCAAGTPMIVCGAGANAVAGANSHIYYSGLNCWQAAWATGQWLAQQVGGRALIASSLYDSGYDALYAFRLGYETAGGEVLKTRVSYDITDRGEMPALIAAIAHAKPDFVYASYSGPDADCFLRAYAEAGLGTSVPLATSPFLGQRAMRANAPTTNAITCQPWPADADPFALLGHDTGAMIASAAGALGDAQRTPEAWGEALAAATLESVRGRLHVDADDHTVSGALQMQPLWNGARMTRIPVPTGRESLLEPLRRGQRAGFIQAYLAD